MKLLFGILIIIGGLCGALIGFSSKTVIISSFPIIDGVELSISLGLFSIIVIISGLYNLFSTT
jgi:hypothetical protein